jgi:hypothetical protein
MNYIEVSSNKSMEKPFTIVKFSDEGTSSPFPARIMLQMCNLRDNLLFNEDRKRFDEVYATVIDNFMEIKLAAKELRQLEEQHNIELHQGIAASIQVNGHITINKPIEIQYRAIIKEFFIKGQIIIAALPRVGKVFGLRTAFFFADDDKYEKSSKQLENISKNACFVLDHLKWARSGWYKAFNDIRNTIIHDVFKFPHIKYEVDPESNILAKYPLLSDKVDNCTLLQQFIDRLIELVECCVVFYFSTKLKDGQIIIDIPENKRNPDKVIRYQLCMNIGGQIVPLGNT